jgi:hypothetical protein
MSWIRNTGTLDKFMTREGHDVDEQDLFFSPVTCFIFKGKNLEICKKQLVELPLANVIDVKQRVAVPHHFNADPGFTLKRM